MAPSIIHILGQMIHAHDAATPFPDRGWRERVAAPALSAFAIATFVLAPRSAPGALVVLAAAPSIAQLASRGVLAALRPSPLIVACAIFGIYITANASWSVNLTQASGKVLFYWVALALTGGAVAGLRELGDVALERSQMAVIAVAVAGTGVLLLEVLSGCLLGRILFSFVPLLRPGPKHIVMTDGWVTAIQPYVLNRNIAAMCFVIWPSLLMLRTRAGVLRARRIGLAVLGAAGVAVLLSDHATSVIALSLGGLTLIGSLLAARVVCGVIAAVWIAASLLAPPIASLAFEHQLQTAAWLPQTARNRIILWGYTAGEIKKAPLLGMGVASTRDIDTGRARNAVRPEGYGYPLRTGRHSHSIFMQTWYELGGVGAMLLLGIGLLGLGALSRLPQADQPLAMAGFVTAVTMGASSWGMWQTWFMAAYGIWAILLALALEGARRRRQA